MNKDTIKLRSVITAFAPMMKYLTDITPCQNGQCQIKFEFPANIFSDFHHPDLLREFFSETWVLDLSDHEAIHVGDKVVYLDDPVMEFKGKLLDDGTAFWFVKLWHRYRKRNGYGESPIQALEKILVNSTFEKEAQFKIGR